MSRTPIPFATADVATLARALQKELSSAPEKLGHVELLNLFARTAGFRNYQHMRANAVAAEKLDAPTPIIPPEPPVDHARIAKVLRFFAPDGLLTRWPPKASLRILVLWALWARLPARAVLDERGISDKLKALHGFGDHALLRRELVDGGWFTRTQDGREYRRVERRPPPEAREIIRRLGATAA